MLRSVKVRDYMDREAITLSPETNVSQAIDVLLANKLPCALVVDAQGQLAGILSDGDCLRGTLNEAYFEETWGTVAALMTEPVDSIDSDADIIHAASLFVEKGRRILPVTAQGRLVGQITRRDLLRALQSYSKQRP